MPQYNAIASFADALTRKTITEFCKTLVSRIHTKVQKTLTDTLIEKSPVGSGRDKHPGMIRDSWRSDASGEIPAGSETSILNKAPHMQIINRGRLQGVNTTRMLGSLQSPKGVTKPAFRKLREMRDTIIGDAIKSLESE